MDWHTEKLKKDMIFHMIATLSDTVNLKRLSDKKGRRPTLTFEFEQLLVNMLIKISDIGICLTRIEIINFVSDKFDGEITFL